METKILSILRNILEDQGLDKTCSWSNCKKWDSLHHLEICFKLEEEFNISIEPEEMPSIRSYSDIVCFLTNKL